MTGRLIRLLAPALLVALAVLGVAAAPASAHAVLVDSSPRDGVRLDRAPAQVVLRFDEPVTIVPGLTRVIASGGGRVDSAEPFSGDGGRSVIVPLRPVLDGRHAGYLVSWRVVSADTHVVSGSLRFGVGQEPESAPPATGTADPMTVLSGVGTGLGYAGLVGLVGCPAVALMIWPSVLRSRRLTRVIMGGGLSVIVGTMIEVLAADPEATGSGWAGLLQADGLADTVQSRAGGLLLARLVLVLASVPLILEVLARARGSHRGAEQFAAESFLGRLWIVLVAGLLIDVAAHGHASAGPAPELAMLATVAHLAGMCGWLGGLVVLGVIILPRLRTPSRATARVIRPWSRFAFGSVALVILSGEYLGWRQVQPVEALWSTRYGAVLLIKLGLVLVALLAGRAAAAISRSRRTAQRLRLIVAAETAITATVVAAATVLSGTPPARETYGPPETAVVRYELGRLDVAVASTRRGPQQITVTSQDRLGRPLPLRELTGRLSSTGAGVADIAVHFSGANNRWQSTDATAPIPGPWSLQLTASPRSGPSYVLEVDYRVW